MTTKTKTTTVDKDEPKTADTTQAEAAAQLKPGEQVEVAPGQFLTGVGESTQTEECVVKADFHVGRAVPGTKVCSYHTMHYKADGTPRGE